MNKELEVDYGDFQDVVLNSPDTGWHQIGDNLYLRRYGQTFHVQVKSDYPEQAGELVIRSDDVPKFTQALNKVYRGIKDDVEAWKKDTSESSARIQLGKEQSSDSKKLKTK